MATAKPDIVERLRKLAKWLRLTLPATMQTIWPSDILLRTNEAADGIDALLDEITALRKRLEDAERERDEAYERAAVTAWHIGMDEHKRTLGLPADAREIGSRCAAAIRALAKGEK